MRDVVARRPLAAQRVVIVLHRRTAANAILGAEPAALGVERLRPGVADQRLEAVGEAPVELHLQRVIPALANEVAIEHGRLVRVRAPLANLFWRPRPRRQRGVRRAVVLEPLGATADIGDRERQVVLQLLLDLHVPLVRIGGLGPRIRVPAGTSERRRVGQRSAAELVGPADAGERLADRVVRGLRELLVRPRPDRLLEPLHDTCEAVVVHAVSGAQHGRVAQAPGNADPRLEAVVRGLVQVRIIGQLDVLAVRQVREVAAAGYARRDADLRARARQHPAADQPVPGVPIEPGLQAAVHLAHPVGVIAQADVDRHPAAGLPLVLDVQA